MLQESMSKVLEDVSIRSDLQTSASKVGLNVGENFSYRAEIPLSPIMSPSSTPTPSLVPTCVEPKKVPMQSGIQPSPIQTLQPLGSSALSALPPQGYEIQQMAPMVANIAAPAAAVPVGYAQCQTIVHPPVTMPSSMVTDVQHGGPTMQEVRDALRHERTCIFGVIQETISQQIKQCMDSRNVEVNRVIAAANSSYAACEERVSRLEVDRAARENSLKCLKREADAQREKVDQILMQLSNDNRSMLDKIAIHKEEVLLSHQALQRKLETSVFELSVSHVRQTLQGFAAEMQASLGGLTDRIALSEVKLQDLCRSVMEFDIAELKQSVNYEKQSRVGFSESLNAYRAAYVQTFKDFRSELDSVHEKLRKPPVESSEVRNRLAAVERTLGDTRSSLATMSTCSISQDVQDLSRQLVDLSQSVDSYRNAHLESSAELSSRCDRISEKLSLMEACSNRREQELE